MIIKKGIATRIKKTREAKGLTLFILRRRVKINGNKTI